MSNKQDRVFKGSWGAAQKKYHVGGGWCGLHDCNLCRFTFGQSYGVFRNVHFTFSISSYLLWSAITY